MIESNRILGCMKLVNFCVLCVLLVVLRQGSAFGETPELRLSRIIPMSDGFGLVFAPEPAEWVVLEKSSDLREWSELVNYKSRVQSELFIDSISPEVTHRFYRLRTPGKSIAEMRARWEAQNLKRYQYRVMRIIQGVVPPQQGSGPGFFSGTLTVFDGEKTLTWEPESDTPGPEDFPTIDELFDWLGMAEADERQLRHMWVVYDHEYGFPSEARIYLYLNPENPLDYYMTRIQISGFTLIE
jgi:hypothetical protein